MDTQQNTPPVPNIPPISPAPTTVPVRPTPPLSPKPQPRKERRPFSISKRSALIGVIAVALLLVVGTTFVARDTMPEDRLYYTKTHTYEGALALTKLSESAKLAYDISRTEARLAELQSLVADQATTSPEVAIEVGNLVEIHTKHFVTTLNDSSLSLTDRIDTLAKIDAVAKAAERVVDDNEELTSAKEAIERGRDAIDESRRVAMESLSSSDDTAAIQKYLQVLIARVGERIGTVAQGSDAQRIALMRINDANDAIEEMDFGHALIALLRADQAIDLDQYLYAAERGEGPQKKGAGPETTEGQ